MKQANHNEVDLLLRSLARGRKGAAWSALDTGDREPVSSAHLDIDELNTFAEGVAPAPARARYTEHLADCESCRSIVVGLTQAAGVAGRLEAPQQKGGASFWQRLGGLLSPSVLRYAAPALVLIAFIGIGLLALRQRPQARLVARNEPSTATLPSVKQTDTAPLPNPTVDAQNKVNDGFLTEPSRGLADKKTPEGYDKLKAGELQPDSSASKAGPKDSREAVAGVATEETRPYAAEPKTATPPPPAPATVFDSQKGAELAKEQPAKREAQTRDQDELYRNESDDVHGPNRGRRNDAPAAAQRSGAVVGGRGPSGMDKNKKAADVETRTVLGRHFTREGDAWVDVAYDSSRGAVRFKRDSEPFRALVADEPGIRTIAEQLDGVVIVVWKGRAYRIQ